MSAECARLQAEASGSRLAAAEASARAGGAVEATKGLRRQLALLTGRLNEMCLRVEALHRASAEAQQEAHRVTQQAERVAAELRLLGQEVLTEAEILDFFS